MEGKPEEARQTANSRKARKATARAEAGEASEAAEARKAAAGEASSRASSPVVWHEGADGAPPCGMPILAFVKTRNGRELGIPVSGVVQTDYSLQRPMFREAYSATQIGVGSIVRWTPLRELLER